MAKQASVQDEIPAVNMSNTKKELLDAYEAAKAENDHIQQQLLSAEEARRKAEKLAAVKTAEAQASGDPVRRLQDLRAEIGRELMDIAQRYETEINTFKQVQQAISNKQSELEELYGIETAVGDLAALIAAQQVRKDEFAAEMSRRKLDLEMEIKEGQEAWAEERAQHAAEIKEAAEELKKKRQREQDDYDYTLKREREQRRNQLADEMAALEKEISLKRAQFEAETEAREKNLAEREQAVAGNEAEMAQLRSQIAMLQDEMETKVKEATVQTTKRLEMDFSKARDLMQARFDGEKNVMLGKIEALEAMVASQREQLVSLAEKQEKAYEKVQDIANRAVAAAKREVITIANHGGGKGQDA